jgi:hypothetical protein
MIDHAAQEPRFKASDAPQQLEALPSNTNLMMSSNRAHAHKDLVRKDVKMPMQPWYPLFGRGVLLCRIPTLSARMS